MPGYTHCNSLPQSRRQGLRGPKSVYYPHPSVYLGWSACSTMVGRLFETVRICPDPLTAAYSSLYSAALLLLVDLTNVSQTELQKIIAFEDAFPRTFHLIQQEGGIGDGGIVVQDCLSLIANLTRHSSSNQSLFRESGCVPQLVELVKQSAATDAEENAYSRGNREKNAWGLLAVVRLFLEKGEVGTKPNQDAFWRYGMVQLVLNLAFENGAAPPIRTSVSRSACNSV